MKTSLFVYCGIGVVVLLGGLAIIKSQSAPPRNPTWTQNDLDFVTSGMVDSAFQRVERDCMSSPAAMQQVKELENQYKTARHSPATLVQLETRVRDCQSLVASQVSADKRAQFNSDFQALQSTIHSTESAHFTP